MVLPTLADRHALHFLAYAQNRRKVNLWEPFGKEPVICESSQ